MSIEFSKFEEYQSHLLLKDKLFQARIEPLERGIWRVLIWFRLQDNNKKSWIIEPQKQQQLHLNQKESQINLSSELHINLAPFSIHWNQLELYNFTGHKNIPTQFSGFSHLATESGHPLQELCDGYPIKGGMSFAIREVSQRAYYGLGERTGYINKKGDIWQNWNTDTTPHLPDTDPLYQSHPFLIGVDNGQAFGLYLDESWYSSFDLAYSHPEASTVYCQSPTLDLYLIPGPRVKDVVQNYTHLLGHAPMPSLWSLGYHQCRWSYPDQTHVESIVTEFKKRHIPLDTIWLDIDYMDSYKVFSFSTTRFPDMKSMVDNFKKQGVKTVAIVDPGVKKESGYSVYEEGAKRQAFVRDRRENELVGEVWPQPAVWPDFSQSAIRDWWGDLHQFYLSAGLAGIWNDMNEPSAFNFPARTLPLGARHGQFWHGEIHNLYGYLMGKSTFQGLKRLQKNKRPFVLTRSGFAGIHKYSWVWTGDNSSHWQHLEESIPMLLNMSLSAIPFVGADIGGFGSDCNGELMARWMWLGAFYPFMRNHSAKSTRCQEPWSFEEPFQSAIIKAIEFRYQLLPYLYTLAYTAHIKGHPIFRPLFYEFSSDKTSYTLSDQFMLGSDLMIAPALRPEQSKRMVYFPPQNKWFDFWSGQEIKSGWQIIETPLNSIPLFQREGSAIPLTEVAQHTTTAEWDHLIWQIAPATKIFGQVYLDKGDGPVDGKIFELSGSLKTDQLELDIPDTGSKTVVHISGHLDHGILIVDDINPSNADMSIISLN